MSQFFKNRITKISILTVMLSYIHTKIDGYLNIKFKIKPVSLFSELL